MMAIEPLELDVREELRNGGEPLPRILGTIKTLKPDQALRLRATFEPIPLYALLGRQGFAHETTHHGEGDWEILFTPGAPPPPPRGAAETRKPAEGDTGGAWPDPSVSLDNRGLSPPEPMMRILDALEHVAPGGVVEALNEREPMFLYPELEKRGAVIRVDRRPDGAVRLQIRRGA